jgi:hypothetical protein
MITEEAFAVIADFGLQIEDGDSNSRNGQVAPSPPTFALDFLKQVGDTISQAKSDVWGCPLPGGFSVSLHSASHSQNARSPHHLQRTDHVLIEPDISLANDITIKPI